MYQRHEVSAVYASALRAARDDVVAGPRWARHQEVALVPTSLQRESGSGHVLDSVLLHRLLRHFHLASNKGTS